MENLPNSKKFPPKGGEVMVEMLVDCIIFLAATYISSKIQLEILSISDFKFDMNQEDRLKFLSRVFDEKETMKRSFNL